MLISMASNLIPIAKLSLRGPGRPGLTRLLLSGMEMGRRTAIARSGWPKSMTSCMRRWGYIRMKRRWPRMTAYEKMREWAKHPKVIAWGEIGLDYFYDHSPRDVQKQVFIRQMELAKEAKLPIVIHCRPSNNGEDAWEDCLRLDS